MIVSNNFRRFVGKFFLSKENYMYGSMNIGK